MSFLTLEDVNGARFSNQHFFWHEIDNLLIGDRDFSNVKLDFCTVSRSTSGSNHTFTFVIDHEYWTKGYYIKVHSSTLPAFNPTLNGNTLTVVTTWSSIRLFLYLGLESYDNLTEVQGMILTDDLNLKYNELNTSQSIRFKSFSTGAIDSINVSVDVGINEISYSSVIPFGFLLVNLVKSDFVFNCTQELTVGKVNKVKLGTANDYKPNGDMIGANTPTITVLYKDTYIDAVWDSTLNDYCFNIDLSDKQNESNVRFKVIVEANDVINSTVTDVSLPASYESINNLTKLTALFSNGGVGRLSSNITLTDDLTLSKSVYIVGNDKTLTMAGHKIVVPSDKTFKVTNLTFTGGNNTIQQNVSSKAELISCSFTNCTGLGSVIDCQVDIGSLENATDFTTILTSCTFSNNDMCILHGGDLTVDGCTVTGKIGNKDYPYFVYQTDGEATITGTSFTLTEDTQISTDIEFNSCIFICGENAVINNGDHTEWQTNNITGFLSNSRNTSSIDVTYYYDAITDYITLNSDNGFCHSVSGADMIYKTNVTATRSE